MGFIKAFLLSLAAFVGLNLIFIILNYAFIGFNEFIDVISRAPLMILYFLFGSITVTPFISLNRAIPGDLLETSLSIQTNIILGFGFIIAPLLAAILAGRFGESKIQSFGGWALTAIIGTILTIVGGSLSETFRTTLAESYGWSSSVQELSSDLLIRIIILISLSGLISIIFNGFFALLLTREEYY